MIFPKVHTKVFGLKEADKTIAIDVLLKARTRIDSEDGHWVCLVIGDVSMIDRIGICGDYGQTEETERIGTAMTDEIERRLGDRSFVTGWLQDAMGHDAYQDRNFSNREYRMAWIDSMIEELK